MDFSLPVAGSDTLWNTSSFLESPLSLRRDPGWGWSRVSQNLGDFLNVCLGRGASVGLVIVARKAISMHLILWPDGH